LLKASPSWYKAFGLGRDFDQVRTQQFTKMKHFSSKLLLLAPFTRAFPSLNSEVSLRSNYKVNSKTFGFETPQYDSEKEHENSLTPFNGYVRVCGLDVARVAPQKWVAVKVIEATHEHEIDRYAIERPMQPVDLGGACYKKGGLLVAEFQSRQVDANDTASRGLLDKHYKQTFLEPESYKILSLLGVQTGFEFTSLKTESLLTWPAEDRPAYSNLYDPKRRNHRSKRKRWRKRSQLQYQKIQNSHPMV
jgi:hypothetical protein